MTPDAALRRDLERLPSTTLVPAGWVLERLKAVQIDGAPTEELEIDLTCEEVATLLHRSPTSVRAYCGAGLFPGAYQFNGRQWRVPRSGIAAFQKRQQQVHIERSRQVRRTSRCSRRYSP